MLGRKGREEGEKVKNNKIINRKIMLKNKMIA